jgi:hypothetical protein
LKPTYTIQPAFQALEEVCCQLALKGRTNYSNGFQPITEGANEQ